jgi:hypothetical protein
MRRHARSLGLRVSKSRSHDEWGQPVGYIVIDPSCNFLASSEYGMDLDELETWLLRDQLG